MVYGFAKQSRGHLELESVVGRGTSVTLYLPRAENVLIEETTHEETTAWGNTATRACWSSRTSACSRTSSSAS